MREGKYQIGSKGFHGSANPYPLLASMFGTGAPVNEGHYANPEMDNLLEQARHATTEEERIRLYDEAQTLANEDIVNIWYATGYFGLIAQRYVHGIERSGGGLTYYANLWREEE